MMITRVIRLLNVLLLSLCAGGSLGVSSRTVKRQASLGAPYPTFTSVPKTSFACDQFGPGYYADPETDCQVFHVCHAAAVDSFICPPGTVFNQKVFVCDWWYNVECSVSGQFYSLNSLIGREDSAAGPRAEPGRGEAEGRARGGSRIQAEPSFEDNLVDERGDPLTQLTQDVTERVDTEGRRAGKALIVTSTGPEENYEFTPSSDGSGRDVLVTDVGDEAEFGASSDDRADGLASWGRVLGNAIATESRQSAKTSLFSNSQSSQKASNSAPSNSLRPNTVIKSTASSKASEGSPNRRKTSNQAGKATVSPAPARSSRPTPFTAFQSSTSRPFRPTIPPFSRPRNRPQAQRVASPNRNAISSSSDPKPIQRPNTATVDDSTQRSSLVQSVTSKPSGLQLSNTPSQTPSRSSPELPPPRPAVSKATAPQPSPERPSIVTPPPSPAPPRPAPAAPSPPQYRFDRVRAELAGRLAGVEPLNVPADVLASETRPPALPEVQSPDRGSLAFSARGQPRLDWLYALGGLVL